ncbi:MAG: WG repeat-containing protein, partial [Clostridiales bacterium]|nr:WG repeat-containing protein [Clostridiales bacterium]
DSGEVSGRYYFWRPVVFYEYISVCRDGKWGVIDYDGQEILPCVYHEPVCFSEGLAAVLSDDQKTYSYIDISGNPVLGPYETPPIQYTEWHVNDNFLLNGMFFLEDRVRFRSGTKYGVHDRTGAVIVPAQYDYVTSFYLGMAKTDLDGQIGVIDKNGGFLIEPGKDDIMPHDEGTVILSTQSGQYMFNISTGERSLWISRDDLQYAYADGKLTVTWSGGELTFPGNDRAELLDNGNLAVTHTEEGKWEIVNPAGYSVAGPFKGRVDNVRDGIIYVLPPESDDRYGSFVDLYTSEGVYLPGVYVNIIPLDGRFLVRQHNSAGLMDASGNWVIKVPLYDYKPD